MRRYAGVLRLVDAGLKIQRHMLARDEEVLVVDGQRSRAVVGKLLRSRFVLRRRSCPANLQIKNEQQRKQYRPQQAPQQLLHEILPDYLGPGWGGVFPVLSRERRPEADLRVISGCMPETLARVSAFVD